MEWYSPSRSGSTIPRRCSGSMETTPLAPIQPSLVFPAVRAHPKLASEMRPYATIPYRPPPSLTLRSVKLGRPTLARSWDRIAHAPVILLLLLLLPLPPHPTPPPFPLSPTVGLLLILILDRPVALDRLNPYSQSCSAILNWALTETILTTRSYIPVSSSVCCATRVNTNGSYRLCTARVDAV